jgi:hypothetical protein
MSFEYSRQRATECRERTSREDGVRCCHGLLASRPSCLNWWSASTSPPSRAETITSSGEPIRSISPGFSPEAAT